MKKHKDTHKTELEKKLEQEVAAAEAESGQPAATEQPNVPAIMAERDQAKGQLLRTLADYDNYRKRVARDSDRNRKLAAEAIVRDMLPILDNLERAVDHAGAEAGPLAEGVKMVLDQFRAVLERHGLKHIPALGVPFDPNVHEAVMQAESDELPPDHVVQEFEKGYTLGDFIIRPSKVIVSKEPAEPKGSEPAAVEGEKSEND